MQFKRHWGGQMGHTPIYRREDAACQWIEIDMLKLAVGQSFDYDEMDKEYALILLGGTGSVTGSSFAFEEIGKRGDVFGGPATAVYVPRNRAFTVTAKTELTIAVCKSPAVKDFDPVLVRIWESQAGNDRRTSSLTNGWMPTSFILEKHL